MSTEEFSIISNVYCRVNPLRPDINTKLWESSEFKPMHDNELINFLRANNYSITRDENFYTDEARTKVYNKGVYTIESREKMLFSDKSLDLINCILNVIFKKES